MGLTAKEFSKLPFEEKLKREHELSPEEMSEFRWLYDYPVGEDAGTVEVTEEEMKAGRKKLEEVIKLDEEAKRRYEEAQKSGRKVRIWIDYEHMCVYEVDESEKKTDKEENR